MKPTVNTNPRTRMPEPQYYSVAQVSRVFGISTVSLYRAIKDGEFPAVKIRGRVFVPRRAIDEMTESAVAEQTVVDSANWVPEEVS